MQLVQPSQCLTLKVQLITTPNGEERGGNPFLRTLLEHRTELSVFGTVHSATWQSDGNIKLDCKYKGKSHPLT